MLQSLTLSVPETFVLHFLYKGIMQEVACTLRVSSYTYQLLCTVGNTEIIIEKDDEGNLRALDPDSVSGKNQKTDPGLIKALVEEMERVLQ
jgi:hypothetical protein